MFDVKTAGVGIDLPQPLLESRAFHAPTVDDGRAVPGTFVVGAV